MPAPKQVGRNGRTAPGGTGPQLTPKAVFLWCGTAYADFMKVVCDEAKRRQTEPGAGTRLLDSIRHLTLVHIIFSSRRLCLRRLLELLMGDHSDHFNVLRAAAAAPQQPCSNCSVCKEMADRAAARRMHDDVHEPSGGVKFLGALASTKLRATTSAYSWLVGMVVTALCTVAEFTETDSTATFTLVQLLRWATGEWQSNESVPAPIIAAFQPLRSLRGRRDKESEPAKSMLPEADELLDVFGALGAEGLLSGLLDEAGSTRLLGCCGVVPGALRAFVVKPYPATAVDFAALWYTAAASDGMPYIDVLPFKMSADLAAQRAVALPDGHTAFDPRVTVQTLSEKHPWFADLHAWRCFCATHSGRGERGDADYLAAETDPLLFANDQDLYRFAAVAPPRDKPVSAATAAETASRLRAAIRPKVVDISEEMVRELIAVVLRTPGNCAEAAGAAAAMDTGHGVEATAADRGPGARGSERRQNAAPAAELKAPDLAHGDVEMGVVVDDDAPPRLIPERPARSRTVELVRNEDVVGQLTDVANALETGIASESEAEIGPDDDAAD